MLNNIMDLFFLLLINLIPLYLIIGAGYFAGKFLHIDRQALANIALYILVPVVIFGFVAELDFKTEYILLPVVAYIISVIVAFLFLWIGRKSYGDNRANLLALCSSMGNTGYFGLPVALLLFDKHYLGIYMFMLVGITTFEATVGYYLAARGRYNVRGSFIKLAKFPSIYAVFAGLAFNMSGFELPELFVTYWTYFKGAYVITGMMIIGAALAPVKKFSVVPKFTALAFVGKFIVWPLVTWVFVEIDRTFTHLFEEEIYHLLYLLAVVPPAANIAAFAAQMDLRPEKAATTILLGTVFALFYIPFVLALIGI
jgi:malate permease and related proteins